MGNTEQKLHEQVILTSIVSPPLSTQTYGLTGSYVLQLAEKD